MTQEKGRMDLSNETRELTDMVEENLLGSILVAGTDGTRTAIDSVSRIISINDFIQSPYNNIRKRIYDAMIKSENTDQISVACTMNTLGTLEPKDIAYMSHLVAITGGIEYDLYAKQVKTLADGRRGNKGNVKPRFKGGI